MFNREEEGHAQKHLTDKLYENERNVKKVDKALKYE